MVIASFIFSIISIIIAICTFFGLNGHAKLWLDAKIKKHKERPKKEKEYKVDKKQYRELMGSFKKKWKYTEVPDKDEEDDGSLDW